MDSTAGLLYGAAFVALENVFTRIGQDFSAFQGWSAWLAQFTALLPALIGIGLGRNPSGFLADAFERYGALIRDAKRMLVGGIGARVADLVPRVPSRDRQLDLRDRDRGPRGGAAALRPASRGSATASVEPRHEATVRFRSS